MNDELPTTAGESLSPTGRRRREAILAAALVEASGRRRRYRRRRAVRAVAASAVAVAIVGVIVAGRFGSSPGPVVVDRPDPVEAPATAPQAPDTPHVVSPDVPPTPPNPAVATANEPPKVVIEILRTDPSIVDRLAIPRTTSGWETINTDELLRQMQRLGLSGGVVVRDGKPRLWMRTASGG